MSTRLMTPEEALERWPLDEYDGDTLGGMRRDIILEAWHLAAELPPNLDWFRDAWLDSIADGQTTLDKQQEEGLRTAFRHLMGYELPSV